MFTVLDQVLEGAIHEFLNVLTVGQYTTTFLIDYFMHGLAYANNFYFDHHTKTSTVIYIPSSQAVYARRRRRRSPIARPVKRALEAKSEGKLPRPLDSLILPESMLRVELF